VKSFIISNNNVLNGKREDGVGGGYASRTSMEEMRIYCGFETPINRVF
jgi:hypothetical protein